MTITGADIDRARRDPVVFADLLIGQPLWDHQVEVVRSAARYRVICAGRRSGKSRTFGVLSLHRAFSVPWSKVLIVSASDTAAKRLFSEISNMATGSKYLTASIDEDTKSLLTLSNGSTIECVPASMKAVRSAEADLLIVDEAGFVPQEIWEAAEPVVGARAGARVLICSTPWGSSEHFFRGLWNQGMDRPDAEVASWHWPSTISPQLDLVWLEGVRGRSSREYFEREYLAQWTDGAGAYFTEAEIMGAVADYEMCAPEDLEYWLERPYAAAGGIDWGMARDANALVLVSVLEDYGLNAEKRGDQLSFFIPWFEARHQWDYSDFIERVVAVAGRYYIRTLASETNGVGAYPTQDLTRRLHEANRGCAVAAVVTDLRRKQSGFGMIKGLLQQQRLILPREPELLKQMRGLEFEQLPAGGVRISVPERAGHDDIVMALLQAVSGLFVEGAHRWNGAPRPAWRGADDELTSTPRGFRMPINARPVTQHQSAFWWARGSEGGEGW